MPHDANGKLIAAGDEVIVRCKVKEVFATEEYCNATLETVLPMFPGEHKSGFTLNTRQVEKVEGDA